MNNYEFADVIEELSYHCDGLRNYDTIVDYYPLQNILSVKNSFDNRVLDVYNNVSLSNVKQLLFRINKCMKIDGFENLLEVKINYR